MKYMLIALLTLSACAAEPARPMADGSFDSRRSALAQDGDGAFKLRARRLHDEKVVEWKASETAVIICDMWDAHWCKSATRRCGELAPKIDAFVKAARAKGALIVHA